VITKSFFTALNLFYAAHYNLNNARPMLLEEET